MLSNAKAGADLDEKLSTRHAIARVHEELEGFRASNEDEIFELAKTHARDNADGWLAAGVGAYNRDIEGKEDSPQLKAELIKVTHRLLDMIHPEGYAAMLAGLSGQSAGGAAPVAAVAAAVEPEVVQPQKVVDPLYGIEIKGSKDDALKIAEEGRAAGEAGRDDLLEAFKHISRNKGSNYWRFRLYREAFMAARGADAEVTQAPAAKAVKPVAPKAAPAAEPAKVAPVVAELPAPSLAQPEPVDVVEAVPVAVEAPQEEVAPETDVLDESQEPAAEVIEPEAVVAEQAPVEPATARRPIAGLSPRPSSTQAPAAQPVQAAAAQSPLVPARPGVAHQPQPNATASVARQSPPIAYDAGSAAVALVFPDHAEDQDDDQSYGGEDEFADPREDEYRVDRAAVVRTEGPGPGIDYDGDPFDLEAGRAAPDDGWNRPYKDSPPDPGFGDEPLRGLDLRPRPQPAREQPLLAIPLRPPGRPLQAPAPAVADPVAETSAAAPAAPPRTPARQPMVVPPRKPQPAAAAPFRAGAGTSVRVSSETAERIRLLSEMREGEGKVAGSRS